MAGCQEEDWLHWGAEVSSEDGHKGMLTNFCSLQGFLHLDKNSASSV